MLDEFSDSKDLPGQAKLILDCRPWLDGTSGIIGSVEVPCVET